MFQCKRYLNTCLVLITMVVRLLVEDNILSFFPLLWIGIEKNNILDIKCHDSYLVKCLHNNISQNDTIW